METRRDKIQLMTERHTRDEIAEMLNKLALIFLRQEPDAPDRCFEVIETEENNKTAN